MKSFLLAFLFLSVSGALPAADPLEDGFRKPPPEARLRCYWWWLNGHVTEASIGRDLGEMKAKGFGGAIIVDAGGAEQRGNDRVPAGPLFGSPPWRALYRHALKEADRLGLELSLNILSGWNLGGPGVEPKDAAKVAVWTAIQVSGPGPVTQKLTPPPAKTGFYRDVAVLAYPLRHGKSPAREPIRQLKIKVASEEFGMSTPDTRPLLTDVPGTPGEEDAAPNQVLDLTEKLDSSGQLNWTVPLGEWEILRFGYAASGALVSTSSDAWQGLAIDYLSRASLETYWNRVVAPLIEDARPFIGKSLKYLVTDSWELGGANWTDRFRDQFRRLRGYDILPWAPVITGRIIGSREQSTRFLNDYRRTIGDLIAAEHYAVFEDLARRHGLGIHPESGGPHGAPIDSLRNLGIGAFPQMEFWAKAKTHRIKDEERFFVKEAASAAHIYGKPFVAAEAFTSIGPHWEETLWDNLKPSFDRAVCEGLNRVIWHTVTNSPEEEGKPGQEYFAGTHFNPNVTWWNQSGAFLDYLNRSSFLAQQGEFVADVLYYYGDQVPNFIRLKSADPARVLPGFDYDGCDTYTLLHSATVRAGRIVLASGMTYRLLALPDVESMPPAVLRKIRDLVNAGATVVGPRPRSSSTLAGSEDFQNLTNSLWGQRRIVSDQSARELLLKTGTRPDFEFQGATGGAYIDYLHRRAGGADIYFISNQTPDAQTLDATFRVRGKTPELWLPITGQIRVQALFRSTSDGRTALPLRLEPYGSVFVVFRKPAAGHFVSTTGQAEVFEGGRGRMLLAKTAGQYTLTTAGGKKVEVRAPEPPAPLAVSGPWRVRFAKGWGAPEQMEMRKLASWTESDNASVKYFSGTAVYEKDIEIPAPLAGSGRLELDLGEVHEIAQVRLNGRDLGVQWAMPRTLDITGAARPGRNRLEIEVTNLWPNRLIGDAALPPAQRLTRTNIRKFTKDSPLLPSGLLGPVVIRALPLVTLP